MGAEHDERFALRVVDWPTGEVRLRAVPFRPEQMKAAIEAEPEAWLGHAHMESFGADTRLLVKLLDAGQRLPT